LNVPSFVPTAVGLALVAAVSGLALYTVRLYFDRLEQLVLQVEEEEEAQAKTRRSEGFLLAEEEGNPDPMLAQASRELDAARLALNRGEADTASTYLDQSETWCRRASDAVERQVAACAFCEEAFPRLKARGAALNETSAALFDVQVQLQQLHDSAAWQGVAGNRDRGTELLEALQPLMQQAAEDQAADRQRYFHAEDLLVHVEQQLAHAGQLFDAVEGRLGALNEARDAARELTAKAENELAAMQKYVDAHRNILGEDQERMARSAEEWFATLQGETAVSTPHWPRIHRRLQQGLQAIAESRQEAEKDVAAYRRLIEQLHQVHEEARKVKTVLDQHLEDRPQANRRYAEAERVLGRIDAACETGEADWEGLLKQLDDVRGDLSDADRLAQADLDLARQAREAARNAEQTIRHAQEFYRHGVSASVSVARDRLERARRELRGQDYESALESVADAQHEARNARDLAARQAKEKQREVMRRRLQQAAGAVLHAAIAVHAAQSGRSHSRVPLPPRRIPTRPIPTRPTFPSRMWGSGSR
jgi:hypothetical protein